MSSKIQKTTRQQLAAYRAHRTRLVNTLAAASTRSVKKAIKQQIAGYDALLLDLAPTKQAA